MTEAGGRTKNNYRMALLTLFSYARDKRHLPRGEKTEAEFSTRYDDKGGNIGIYTPQEFRVLLTNIDERFLPFVALGGFAGLRSIEIFRLDWQDIWFDKGVIEVGKDKAKTATRRLSPILPALEAWLKPHAKSSGPAVWFRDEFHFTRRFKAATDKLINAQGRLLARSDWPPDDLTGEDLASACQTLARDFRDPSTAEIGLSFPIERHIRFEQKRRLFHELAARYAVPNEANWSIARAYLVETRGIEPAIVDDLHAVGTIFANDHRPNPSIVFLHRMQHGKVEGATLRNTRYQSSFRPCLGNKLTAWFTVGHLDRAKIVIAVKSPIDDLSYRTIHACRGDAWATVSCAGTTVPIELMCMALRAPPIVRRRPRQQPSRRARLEEGME